MYEHLSRNQPTEADAVETPQPLSLTQRLNRLRYCCYNLTGAVLVSLSLMLFYILSRSVWIPASLAGLFYAAMAGLSLAALVWFIGLGVRRLHDRNHAGWWLLLMFVPVANLALMLYLLLAPGSAGENRFGGPNPPNGLLVQIFGGLWWFSSLLGAAANVFMLIVSPGMFFQFASHWEQMQSSGAPMERMLN